MGFTVDVMKSGSHGGRRQGGRTNYLDEVRSSIFCLHLRGDTPTSRRLYDAIANGCLPIVVSDALGANLPSVFSTDGGDTFTAEKPANDTLLVLDCAANSDRSAICSVNTSNIAENKKHLK